MISDEKFWRQLRGRKTGGKEKIFHHNWIFDFDSYMIYDFHRKFNCDFLQDFNHGL